MAPDFPATRHVYVRFVTRDADGARVGRVMRFREVGGMLGEAAVMVEGLPAETRAARVRVGPDGALYVGTRPSIRPTRTISGRMREDSAGHHHRRAVADNPLGNSPVVSFGYRGPLRLRLGTGDRVLWSVETSVGGVALRRTVAGSPGAEPAFLEGIQAAGAAFHFGATPAAWRDGLFLASPRG